jgi:hypothetical protein
MEEQLHSRTLELLLQQSIGEERSILLRDALGSPLPAGVRRYLEAEVVSRLESDFHRLPQLDRINSRAPGIRDLERAFLKGLAAGYEISREEYEALLTDAVAFTESFLSRPRQTLEEFVFKDRPSVPTVLARRALEHCGDYAYFRYFLDRALTTHGEPTITREEFHRLLGAIDDQVIQQHSPQELAVLAKPIFDFLLLHDAATDEPIAIEPILAFFEDKQMARHSEHLAHHAELRGTSTITLDQLARLMGALEATEEAKSLSPEPPPGASDVLDRAGPSDRSAVAEPVADEALPLPAQAEHAPASPVKPSSHPPSALPDLRTLMNEKQRQRFVRHVFNRDQAYFYGVIATLNTMRSWSDAASYLAQVYDINRLDPFADVVVEFTDFIQKRFTAGTAR